MILTVFIDGIECISDVRKRFYKNIINLRYNVIREVYNDLILVKSN